MAMRVNLGAGWSIHHLTDRTVELRKDCPIYRRWTNRDGFVFHRVEPGTDRRVLIEGAMEIAKRNDEALALMVGKRLMPSKVQLAKYQNKQVRLVQAFGTPEDPAMIGRKSA